MNWVQLGTWAYVSDRGCFNIKDAAVFVAHLNHGLPLTTLLLDTVLAASHRSSPHLTLTTAPCTRFQVRNCPDGPGSPSPGAKTQHEAAEAGRAPTAARLLAQALGPGFMVSQSTEVGQSGWDTPNTSTPEGNRFKSVAAPLAIIAPR